MMHRNLFTAMTRKAEHTGITALLSALSLAEIRFHDVKTTQSSLEEIFVDLVKRIK